VKATDDLGRNSVADQPFQYDLTVSALKVPKSSKGGIKISFTLSRQASVALLIKTSFGTVVTTIPAAALDTGVQSLSWDGRASTGTSAPAGSYVAYITAVSSVGTIELSAPFTLRG
jgi:flagellar hook assembly protein FlgD